MSPQLDTAISRVRNARVILTDSNGNSRIAVTVSFDYFRFDDVMAGETYTLTVASKRFVFAPRILTINDQIDDLNLIAEL